MKPCRSVQFALGLCLLAQVAFGGSDDQRDVQLTVRVQHAGAGIESIPLAINFPGGLVVAMTNADGEATKVVRVGNDAETLVISASMAGDVTGATREERSAAMKAAALRIGAWAFGRYYSVPLEANRTSYSLVIDVEPAIRVRGRGFRNGIPVRVIALPREGSTQTARYAPLQPGEFDIGGVQRGVASAVYLVSKNDLLRVPVPASADDVDLGDIDMPDRGGTGIVEVALTVPDGAEPRSVQRSSVAFIRTDGALAAVFVVRASPEQSDRSVTLADGGGPAVLPEGEYYVVPGVLTGTLGIIRVYERAVEGVNMRGLGVPTITVVNGQTVHKEVDAVASAAAADNQ